MPIDGASGETPRNRQTSFGGTNVFELADAVDIPDRWREHLSPIYRKDHARTAWEIGLAVLVSCGAVYLLGRSDLVLAGCLGLVGLAVFRYGISEGRQRGYDDGLQAGHVAAVFDAHGIAPDRVGEFWDFCGQATDDKNLAELYASFSRKPR